MNQFLKITFLCVLMFAVVGCVTTSQDDTSLDGELAKSFNREYAKCHAINLTRKSAVVRQTCEDNAFATVSGRSPLFNVIATQNRLAAIAYAEGRTSQAELKATVDSNYATAALRNNQPAPAPVPVQPFLSSPPDYNCPAIGDNIHCSSQ